MSRTPDYSRTLQTIQSFVCAYANGALSVEALNQSWADALGAFDPRDVAARQLNSEQLRLLCAWDRLTGGEWGEYRDELPRRADWAYGESDEPYGWIDASRLQLRYRAYTVALGLGCDGSSAPPWRALIDDGELLSALLDIHEALIRSVARWGVEFDVFLEAYDAFYPRSALDGHESWPPTAVLSASSERIVLHRQVWESVITNYSDSPNADSHGFIGRRQATRALTALWDRFVAAS